MTMHLEGPWLSTTGKRKGKIKFKSAEAKREYERLDREWQELLKRQGVEAEANRRTRAMKAEPLTYRLTAPAGRGNTNHIPSLNSGAGVATVAPPKVYTGTKVMGIATMHKSNAVPVFSSEEAVAISTMRR
jgi:hypothetical protein